MCNLQEHIERCERAKAASGLRDEVASALRFADYGPEGWAGAESLADALLPIIERVKAEAWDKGFDAGYDKVLVERAQVPGAPDMRQNPYRKGADHD